MVLRNKKLLLSGLLVWVSLSLFSQQKKAMDFSVFDGWKAVEKPSVARNGATITYQINPQEGDGNLFIYTGGGVFKSMIPRGYKAQMPSDGSFVAFAIAPQHNVVRKMKLDKVKKDKMPKDSVGIYFDGRIIKYPGMKSFAVPAEDGNWLAIHFENGINSKKDTSKVKKRFKSEGTPLVFFRPSQKDSLKIDKVTEYGIAESGLGGYAVLSVGDSVEVSVLLRFNPATFKVDTLMKQQGKTKQLTVSKKGDHCSFLFSADTAKVKSYSLYHFDARRQKPAEIVAVDNSLTSKGWCASEYGKIKFSDDGSRLFFGIAPRPVAEPKDTLTEDEKYHLDLWAWNDADIQPSQKANLKTEKERTWLCCYDTNRGVAHRIASDTVRDVRTVQNGDSRFALGYNDLNYRREADFTGNAASDLYLVDLLNGNMKLLKLRHNGPAMLTSDGTYLVYYEVADSSWHVKNTNSLYDRRLSVPGNYPFYDEMNDMPSDPYPYGFAGLSDDNRAVYLYDRFDIWLFDLDGKRVPQRITNGRSSATRYRYLMLNPDQKGISARQVNYFSMFNEISKREGIARFEKGKVTTLIEGDYAVLPLIKARNANRFIVRRSTFRQYPELEVTNQSFSNLMVISNTNPQQSEYLWGGIQLVKWTTPAGRNLDGLLVTPENMDPSKKYPMLIYFYERSSDNLYQHSTPRPSRSIINWPYCASNGYVVFIPDVTYDTGQPGNDAYDAIVSGAEAMVSRFGFIDKERMALQGQSWGGYQTAWLITRTNMFRCAMAGAPVSNMTSAYGGIRWETGKSRIFQYERTQSRIGSTLWDNLEGYIENSPLFFAPNVQTPLLMMHNDNDGAVPWYQGIEYFMALRRLNKPVWMLVYNNEAHNLLRRANTKDLTIRMMQFFDYYLKDAPMPVWMRDGIPAVDKDKRTGYEFVK